jgi:hypothetical protein
VPHRDLGIAGRAVTEVPMAVAPRLISRSSARASEMRSTSSPMVVPQPRNSAPSDIGTASCRWVRPIFSTLSNSLPLAKNASCSWRSAVM